MDQGLIAGSLVLGLPLLLIGLILFRRYIPVLLFYVVLLAVGLGYLISTGALADVGHFALSTLGLASDGAMAPPPPPEPAAAP